MDTKKQNHLCVGAIIILAKKAKHCFEQVNHFNMHSSQEIVAFKDHMSSTSLASPLHWAQTKELLQVKPKSTNLDHLESPTEGGVVENKWLQKMEKKEDTSQEK